MWEIMCRVGLSRGGCRVATTVAADVSPGSEPGILSGEVCIRTAALNSQPESGRQDAALYRGEDGCRQKRNQAVNTYRDRRPRPDTPAKQVRSGMAAWIGCVLCVASCLARADSVTLRPVADTRLSAQSPTVNFGDSTDMVIGTQGPNAGTPKNRGLIKFDLTGQIPPASQIQSVALTLTVAKVPLGGVDSTFELRRVLRTWTENQATWNSRATLTDFWSAPGAAAPTDFSSAISATKFVGGVGSYTFGSTTNLVADVQAWLDNPGINFGWIVSTESENVAKSARRFSTREGNANASALVIEYTAAQIQPPRLSPINLLGNTVSFQFDLDPQRPYTVEFNNALNTTNWLTLTNVTAQPSPTNVTISDSIAASQRFYRVKTP